MPHVQVHSFTLESSAVFFAGGSCTFFLMREARVFPAYFWFGIHIHGPNHELRRETLFVWMQPHNFTILVIKFSSLHDAGIKPLQ